MKMKKLIGFLSIAFLVMLTFAGTASADVITVPLSDFLVFSGGGSTGNDAGFETQIAGASLYYGNIGSNWDLSLGASETTILGSVYVGNKFNLRAPSAIGSDGNPSYFPLEPPLGNTIPTYPLQLEEVVAFTADVENNTAQIWGTLDLAGGFLSGSGTPAVSGTQTIGASADTFGLITMTSGVSFTAGGADQSIGNGITLALVPNTYGALTTSQNATLELESGDYYFDRFGTSNSALGGNFTLKIDLSSGNPININIVEYAKFGGDTKLMVMGAGTGGVYVPISQAPELAALINWELGEQFTMIGGDASPANPTTWTSWFGGTLYSHLLSGKGIIVGQHIDWYGALYSYDEIDLADHSRYTYVTTNGNGKVPEPATLIILGSGLIGLWGFRKKFKK